MDLKEKIIFHVIELSLIGLAGYCFSKAQYYQGKIDARTEMTAHLVKIMDEVHTKLNIEEEEA